MAGFCRIALEGEYYNQKIVNILHYRSTAWLPGQGNPFDDTLAFLDAVLAEVQASLLGVLPTEYLLQQATATGYDDTYSIVTPSPLVRTVQQNGALVNAPSVGASLCATISLRCGPQVSINGIGTSKRNRGYLSVGPMVETSVDNYSHIIPGVLALLNTFANDVQTPVTVIAPAVVLTPIRIHEKYLNAGPIHTLLFRTYSDVLGYTLNRVASFRRSRVPEA